jgi:hypothetical protein
VLRGVVVSERRYDGAVESPFIMFEGPALAGARELASRLGWLDACRWQVPQLAGVEWGRLGPVLVRWRDRTMMAELGYRGPLWIPPLESDEWTEYRGPDWSRFRSVVADSLRRVDAVLFIADSQHARLEANLERLQRLGSNLRYVGRLPEVVPVVFALNKRDLEGKAGAQLLSVAELQMELRWPVCRYVETSARTGRGVDEAVAQVLELAGREHDA